jgi:lipopolysaccharide/colanic/teichoic acid biosynthesis glycosyltransferase
VAWEDKFALDVAYIDRRSVQLDLAILAKTALSVLGRRGISGEGQATMSVFTGPRSEQASDDLA